MKEFGKTKEISPKRYINAGGPIMLSLLLLLTGLHNAAWGGSFNGAVDVTEPGGIDIGGDWLITGSQTYTNETIFVDGNMTVRGVLILSDSELFINTSGLVARGIEIESGGTLVIMNGSTVTGTTPNGFFFRALGGSNVLIEESTVLGCGIPGTGPADRGLLSMTSNFTINNTMVLNGEAGLIADGGTFALFNMTIDDMNAHGIMLMNGSSLSMKDSTVRSVIGSGIHSRLSNITLEKVVFDNVGESVTAYNSSALIKGTLLQSSGPYLIRLQGCDFRLEDTHTIDPQIRQILVAGGGASPTELLLINSSVADVILQDTQAIVHSATRFDVKVVMTGGLPGSGAEVDIFNVEGKRAFIGLTDSSGHVKDVVIPYLRHTTTGWRYLTPHTISVFLDGAIRYRTVNVTSSYMETIEVLFSIPQITILYPEDHHWYQGSPVRLEALIDDVRPMSDVWIQIDGRAEVHVGDMKELGMDIHLQDGEHTIRVIAMNDDGKTGNSSVSFGIDSVAPVLTIDAASRVPFTNVSMHYILGSCSDDAVIWVGGSMYPVHDGRFQVPYMLQEGLNRIELIAMDRAGNRDSHTLEVTLDTIPPSIIISSPLNGSGLRENSVKVKGMTDPSTVSLTINGIPALIEDGYFDHLVEGLIEGQNRITITAIDVTGSTSSKRITVMVDTVPPEVVLLGFMELTNQKKMTVQGITDTADSIIYVNGILATITGYNFQAEIELSDGENWIEIRAQDALGNLLIRNRNVFLDREAPVFESFDPPVRSVVRLKVLELKVQVYDENGIQTVRGRVGSSPFKDLEEGPVWKWVTVLVEGENILDLEAVDRAGNVKNVQAIYIYDPPVIRDEVKPEIWFVRPANNETLEKGPIIVEGRARDDVNLSSVQLRLDGGVLQVTGLENWIATIEPPTGAHLLEAVAIDGAGNVNSTMLRFFVVDTGTNPDEDEKGPNIMVLLIIGSIILFLFIILVYLVVNNIRIKALVDEKARMDEEARGSRTRRMPRSAREPRQDRPLSRTVNGRGGRGRR